MRALLLLAPLALAACSAADRQADALDNAAAQSDPAARPALENAADAMRESGDANGAQEALATGGQDQLGTPASPQSEGRVPPPADGGASTTQAAPNTGDRAIPRPQVEGR